MLVGTYYHTLESKGRFSLPKAFRNEATDWVLTAGLDGCLSIFKQDEFEQEASRLVQLSYLQADHRAIIRHFAANASQQQPDSLGRLTIPAHLQELAGLKKKLVIVGALTHIEIWDEERYRRLFDNLALTIEEKSEKIAV